MLPWWDWTVSGVPPTARRRRRSRARALSTTPPASATLAGDGMRVVSGGTDNHLMLVDVTPLGVTDPWLAILPVLAALAAAVAFAVRATARAPIGAIRPALFALLAWGVASIVTPSIAGDSEPPLGGGAATLGLVGLAACASALTLALVRYLERRGRAASQTPALLKRAMQAGDRVS